MSSTDDALAFANSGLTHDWLILALIDASNDRSPLIATSKLSRPTDHPLRQWSHRTADNVLPKIEIKRIKCQNQLNCFTFSQIILYLEVLWKMLFSESKASEDSIHWLTNVLEQRMRDIIGYQMSIVCWELRRNTRALANESRITANKWLFLRFRSELTELINI